MTFITDTVKKAVFWTYPRTSWQWDVLCVLCLIFIFLTPKTWFDNSAYQRTHMGQTAVVVSTDVVGTKLDRGEVERRARVQLGRPSGQINEVHERYDDSGKLIAYQVDIR